MTVRRAHRIRTRSFARRGAVAAAVAVALATAATVANTAAANDAATGNAATGNAATGNAATGNAATGNAASRTAATPTGAVPARTAVPEATVEKRSGTKKATTTTPVTKNVDEPAPEVPTIDIARYRFDNGGGTVFDETGNGHTLRTRAGHGGRTRTVKHGPGMALAFPRKCAKRKCARVVLQAGSVADLNPGTAPIIFGASVRLSRKQTTDGQNVVQKGYSTGGSQYKLQIDGAAGKPSCAMVGDHSPRIHRVKSSVTVADGRWHKIECRRVGTLLGIFVDGVPRGAVGVPQGLSVANAAPLSLGGKGGYQNNDQFQGILDDVWVAVGPS
jgi:hypothetical protein